MQNLKLPFIYLLLCPLKPDTLDIVIYTPHSVLSSSIKTSSVELKSNPPDNREQKNKMQISSQLRNKITPQDSHMSAALWGSRVFFSIALFTVNVSHKHFNVFGKFFSSISARNCLVTTLTNIRMQKVNCEMVFRIGNLRLVLPFVSQRIPFNNR